jgi:hypothetical protein
MVVVPPLNVFAAGARETSIYLSHHTMRGFGVHYYNDCCAGIMIKPLMSEAFNTSISVYHNLLSAAVIHVLYLCVRLCITSLWCVAVQRFRSLMCVLHAVVWHARCRRLQSSRLARSRTTFLE